jgi:hypothetical protein
MYGKLKRFTVLVPFEEGNDGELIPYIQDLVVCMPHLTHLDICMDIPDRLITIYRTAILSHFPSLQTLILRKGHLKSPIINTVCLSPQPGVIQSDSTQVRIFCR